MVAISCCRRPYVSDEDIDAIRRVTLAGINRVAKQYLVSANSITATLKPSPSGEAVAAKGFGGEEKVTSAPTKPVVLPVWAAGLLSQLKVPSDYIVASDTMLPNGIRLIVKTDHTSPTVTVVGEVKTTTICRPPKARKEYPICSMDSTPMAPRRSTAWPSKRRSTTSLPMSPRASISPCRY